MTKKSQQSENPENVTSDTLAGTDNEQLNTTEEKVEADPNGENSDANDSVVELEQTITELQSQLINQQDFALRIKAEADNQLKREQRELEKYKQRSLEKIMRELIEVRDTLERGLEALPADNSTEQYIALHDGTAMTLKLLDKALHNNGLEILDPLHEGFNPELHEAVSMQPSEEYDSNTVIAVLQKGYRLHERLLRPAMVMVST